MRSICHATQHAGLEGEGVMARALIETEGFHPNDGHPYWNESAWFSFNVPERNICGWIYFWHRPNMNYSMGGVCLWDPSSAIPMECMYFEWDQHPIARARGMHQFKWDCGLEVECIESQKAYRFTYDGDGCQLALEWRATM